MSLLNHDLPWPWRASWPSWSWLHRKPLCTWRSHPSQQSGRGAPLESMEMKTNVVKNKNCWRMYHLLKHAGVLHRVCRHCKSTSKSVIHPWKIYTICCGYWKTSLRGCKQEDHFTLTFIITEITVLKTSRTIFVVLLDVFQTFSPPIRGWFGESGVHKKNVLHVWMEEGDVNGSWNVARISSRGFYCHKI